MGSRISWCAKDTRGRMSVYFRQQWKGSVESFSKLTQQHLGEFAHRFDLGAGRIMNALICVANDQGSDVSHRIWDSSDNGLIEFDVSNPECWEIYHYDVDFHTQEPTKQGTKIAELNGNGFNWLIKKEKLDKLGEGLS